MYQIPFSFPIINVKAICGENNRNTREHLFELGHHGSNQFVIVYIGHNIDTSKALDNYGLDVTNINGVIRKNYIHDMTPNPEMTSIDYKNIFNIISNELGKIPSNTYIVYAVDLVEGIIHFNLINADSIKSARHTAKDLLTNYLGIPVLIRNLMLDPVKNSSIGHTSNLSASYIGRLDHMNKYYNHSRFHIGVVKATKSLTYNIKLNSSWVYDCI